MGHLPSVHFGQASIDQCDLSVTVTPFCLTNNSLLLIKYPINSTVYVVAMPTLVLHAACWAGS